MDAVSASRYVTFTVRLAEPAVAGRLFYIFVSIHTTRQLRGYPVMADSIACLHARATEGTALLLRKRLHGESVYGLHRCVANLLESQCSRAPL